MSYSFSEKSSVATVLLVSEVKTSIYQRARARTLAASLSDKSYLVSVQPTIPPFYYHIPCIASAWEQEMRQTEEELLSFGAELDIPPERCLLLHQAGLFRKKIRLQRQLERLLKRPVHLLTLTENEPWLPMLLPAPVRTAYYYRS